jgi:two-component system response regulator AgrA
LIGLLEIFICEDVEIQRKDIEKCIENCIMIHNLDMRIVVSTNDPKEIIAYLENHRAAGLSVGLYFLDYDLNNDMNGMQLANTIREYDPFGYIVVVTSYDDVMPYTFRYKIAALDFITKDEHYRMQRRIHECILNVNRKYSAITSGLQKKFSFKLGDKIIAVEHSKIFYFETTGDADHKIRLHTADGDYEFYGTLKSIEEKLDDDFCRCHNSFIANIRNVQQVVTKERKVQFPQGISCEASERGIRRLNKMMKTKL